MLNAYKVNWNLESEYQIYEKSFSLVLKPSKKYMLLIEQLYGRNINGIKQNTNVGTADVLLSRESSKGSDIRRNAILDLIRSNPSITIPEITIIQKVSTRTIERDLDWLKDRGIIAREGSRSDGQWVIVE